MQVANEVRDEDHAGHAHVEVLGERFNLLYNTIEDGYKYCLGGVIYSIPCRTSYFALRRF